MRSPGSGGSPTTRERADKRQKKQKKKEPRPIMKIIPAIDLRGGKCVRLFQGDYNRETVYGEDPARQARIWEESGAELLHLVDLDGAKAGEPVNLKAVETICKAVKIPCELGGGIRSEKDAGKLFSLGVSRVILGTAACENPALAKSLLASFGRERIVAGIDARNGRAALRGWLETSGVDAFDLARKLHRLGISRIIFTDIATDGAMCGPDLESIRRLCDMLPECRIIASGGVSCKEDVSALVALRKDNLEGVISGKALYDGRVTFSALAAAAAAGPGKNA